MVLGGGGGGGVAVVSLGFCGVFFIIPPGAPPVRAEPISRSGSFSKRARQHPLGRSPPPSPFSGRFVHPSQSRPRASPPPPRGGPCPRGAQALPSASAKGNAVPLLRPFPLKQGPGQGEGGGPLRTPGGIAGGVCNPLCGPPLPPPLALCCQLLSVKRCCCAPSMQVCICVMFRLAL